MKFNTTQTSLSYQPLEVFEGLIGLHDNCFLLETLGDKNQPQTSAQSYIGIAPKHYFAAKEGLFYRDGKAKPTDNSYKELKSQFAVVDGLPPHYVGGLVGYISHEAIHYSEPTLGFSYPRDFFDFEFGQYDDGLIFANNSSPQYFHYGQDRLELYKKGVIKTDKLTIDFIAASKTKTEYQTMVEQAREAIRNGRVFQVVLANKYEYRYTGALLELYKQLREINPSPFMFFIKFGDIVTLGASPELLTHTMPDKSNYIEALAGTIRRGKTPDEDAALSKTLLQDPKEIAEHNMLVDLVRNDAGRVSRLGSVRIENFMYIKKLSHVQHICSMIRSQLMVGKNAFDALESAFPAGTLVGAPKIEATKMITELEGYERGPYGGVVGYFSYNGDSVHAVNIRSVSAIGNKLIMHSGSGIVYDSMAELEYQEISDKKAAMDRAMKPFIKKDAP
jgi:anthranilate synthase component 1